MKAFKIAGAVLLLLVGLLVLVPVLSIVGASGPLLSWAAFIVFVVLLVWFFFGRRRSSSIVVGSESSLMGRQSSKDGLL